MYNEKYIIHLIESSEIASLRIKEHFDLIRQVKEKSYSNDDIALLEFDRYIIIDKNCNVLNKLSEVEASEVGIIGI